MTRTTITDNYSRRDFEDDPELHEPPCALCGDPIAEHPTALEGFAGKFHPLCAAAYCRQHDEFDCEADHADS